MLHPILLASDFISSLSKRAVCIISFRGGPDQNGVSPLHNMLEIHHSGPEPSITALRLYEGNTEIRDFQLLTEIDDDDNNNNNNRNNNSSSNNSNK